MDAAKQNAANAVESAQIHEDQQRLADKRTLASAHAIIGASGVQLTGSPLDVMAESARQAEMNALIIRRGGQLEAHADLVAGANAQSASRIAAAGTILTGATSIARQVAVLGNTRSSNSGSSTSPTYGDPIVGPITG